MSIIQCPECGRDISDQERICNNCGFPLERAIEKNSTETITPLINPGIYIDKQEADVQFTNKPKKKKGIVLITIFTVLALIISAVAIILQKEKNSIKEKLLINTEYVKEHIIGTWETSDGTILEIYGNGFMVNYTPQQNKSLDAESYITSEIKSTGYNGYTIPDISEYTEVDLQSYSDYLDRLKNTDKIGVSLRLNFFGVLPDKLVLFEFQGNDRLLMGDISLTRVGAEEPGISDEIKGLYINKKEKTLTLEVIDVNNTNIGYFEWNATNDGVDGSCTISNDKIILSFAYADDFIFERCGSSLVEIGSNEIQGSNLQYNKISDLSYCGRLNASQVSDIENNSEDNYISEESNSSTDELEITNKSSATVSAQGGLFLREEPSTNANKITLMPDGATVWVSKVDGNWAYVTYNDTVGWCAKEYIGSNEINENNPPEYDDLSQDNEIFNSEEKINDKVSIGDTISFGKNNWKVLDIKNDTALIITNYIISEMPYNNNLEEITWENCSLRKYLNNEFYNDFSESEKNRIVEVANSNLDNPQYGISGGNPTNDKVFLLSIDEANSYDITIPEYVMLNIVWWLRSPGDEKTGAAGVYDCGIVNAEGYYVDGYGGVRPALWLKLND